jgi:hypothetical protein
MTGEGGLFFEGEFKNGKMYGFGRKIWDDLFTEGIFEDNHIIKGTKWNKDGSIK